MIKRNIDKRVAIFQAEWPIQVHTVNCAIMLAEAGYGVELFLFKAQDSRVYCEPEKFVEWDNIWVYNLSDNRGQTNSKAGEDRTKQAKQRLKARFPALVSCVARLYALLSLKFYSILHIYWFLSRSEAGLFRRCIVDKTLEQMDGHNYVCLIGVEKKGLIWAGRVAEKIRAPFVYYSLELHVSDFWRFVMKKSTYFKRLRLAECKYHKKADATIIQSYERANVLFQENGLDISKANVLYLPVSVIGKTYKEKSKALHKILELPHDRKVILYFGMIAKSRHSLELVRVVQNFPEEWVLVMHGFTEDSATLEKIKSIDRRNRVYLSLRMVHSDRITEIIASADIGLSLYSGVLQNDILSAFSSEKMALYMQCGVPFIAFNYNDYQFLADKERCGAVIEDLEDLPSAINEILNSYGEFRKNAYKVFCKYYDHAKNFAKVINGIESLSKGRISE